MSTEPNLEEMINDKKIDDFSHFLDTAFDNLLKTNTDLEVNDNSKSNIHTKVLHQVILSRNMVFFQIFMEKLNEKIPKNQSEFAPIREKILNAQYSEQDHILAKKTPLCFAVKYFSSDASDTDNNEFGVREQGHSMHKIKIEMVKMLLKAGAKARFC